MKTSVNILGRRGFTLIEMMVACVITAFVLSSVAMSLSQLSRAKSTCKERLDAHLRADTAVAALRRDIATIIRTDDLFWTRLLIVDDTVPTALGQMDRDELLVFNHRLRPIRDIDFSGEGLEYETQYRIEEDELGPALWRRRDAVPDEYLLGGGIAAPLVEGIVGLSIEAYDGNEWYHEWDSDYDGLPLAVRLTVIASGHRTGDDVYDAWQNLDLADYVGAEGVLMRTRSGELTLKVDRYTLLAKSLRPLPEKWHGLKDTEIRYRQRYLDLAASDEVREVFRRRAAALRVLRAHMDAHGFIEVETPIMQPQYGGALARPFTTHHNTLGIDLYLRIAPELYLKRLLVGGLERVYELNRNFRNEGVSTQHNPEFTMLEFYAAYWDYRRMMEFVEELLSVTAEAVLGTPDFEYQGKAVSMQRPWKRM